MNVYLNRYLSNVNKEVREYIEKNNYKEIEKAARLIIDQEKKGGRVHVTGVGKPSYVARYIASLLSSVGTSAYYLDATESIHGSSGQVEKEDIVIAISNSGETEELKSCIKNLRENGIKIISCTGNIDSWLSKNSEVTLIARVEKEGDSLNKPPRTSILMELIVLQLLSIELQELKQINLKDYIKWHPGGKLGEATREEINI